jgi:hypothetical protein
MVSCLVGALLSTLFVLQGDQPQRDALAQCITSAQRVPTLSLSPAGPNPPRRPKPISPTHCPRRGGWRAACAEQAAKAWRPYRLFNLTDTLAADADLQAARGRQVVHIISEATAALQGRRRRQRRRRGT